MRLILFFYSFHFIVSIWGAIVFLGAAVVHFDAWRLNKSKRGILIRALGFAIFGFGLAAYAESLTVEGLLAVSQVFAIVGLILITATLLAEPLSISSHKEKVGAIILSKSTSLALFPISAVISFFVGVIYWRRKTNEFEKYGKIISLSFMCFSITEIINFLPYWSKSDNPFVSKVLGDFGLAWITGHVFEFLGIAFLALFIWKLVRSRPRAQIFITMITIIFTSFIFVVIMFMFFLNKAFETNVNMYLEENNKIVQYFLKSEQTKAIAQAQAVAGDSGIQNALQTGDKTLVRSRAEKLFTLQNATTLVVATSSGEVIVRVEDMERTGQKLSDGFAIKQALNGKATSTFVYQQNIPISQITVEASVPIMLSDSNKVVGVVIFGFPIDTAYVDNIKEASGLDVTFFGKNQRIATTFLAGDGETRAVGTFETNQSVIQKVLKDGEGYFIAETILGRPFYGNYLPIKAADGEIVGMLFVGEPQDSLVSTVTHTVDVTVLGSLIVFAISLLPVYYIARQIERNLQKNNVKSKSKIN